MAISLKSIAETSRESWPEKKNRVTQALALGGCFKGTRKTSGGGNGEKTPGRAGGGGGMSCGRSAVENTVTRIRCGGIEPQWARRQG